MNIQKNEPKNSGKLLGFARDLLSILTVIVVVAIAMWLLNSTSGVLAAPQCVIVPHNPFEIILGAVGVVALTVLGAPFAPASVFGLTVWFLFKLWMCNAGG